MRISGEVPKQFLVVGGRSVLQRAVAAYVEHPQVDEVVVALPEETAIDPPSFLRDTLKPVRVVAGGLRRQDSVSNAFQAVSERCDVVIVHDAARPFVSEALISRTIVAAAQSGAALAALPSRDTVKRGTADGRVVAETLPDRKSTRLNSSHIQKSRMPSSA